VVLAIIDSGVGVSSRQFVITLVHVCNYIMSSYVSLEVPNY
jgi:hypothetical protein